MPWTLILADFLEQGKNWDLKEVAEVLRNAQAEIDRLSKEWQGLSDDEICELYDKTDFGDWVINFARTIEAKLKEKNNAM